MRTGRRFLIIGVVLTSLLAAGCEQLVAPPGVAPLRYRDQIFANVTKTSGITYRSTIDQQGNPVTLQLDVYQPTGDTLTQRPLVIFIHGGSFSSGSRTSPEIVDEATTLAREGYVTASISYRLTSGGCSAGSPTATCVTAILSARDDALAAVGFLRTHADDHGIDESRIAVAGTSAGAITAANVAFSRTDNPATSVRAAVSLSGAHLLTVPNLGDAPLLLLHGTADLVVPYAWAQNTVAAATAAGVRTVLTSWEGDGHVPYLAHRTEILEQTRNFLYWHLDLAHAAS